MRAYQYYKREADWKAKLDRAEQYYKREADWKEAGEERSDERAGMLSDTIVADECEGVKRLSSQRLLVYPQYTLLFTCPKFFSSNCSKFAVGFD